jgi:autotransporter-associated beta strand protein
MKNKTVSLFQSAPALVAVAAITFSAAATAAVQVYDSTNPAAVWDTTTVNWDGSTVAWTNGNDALFDTGTGTVTVNQAIGLAKLTISSTTTSSIGGIGTSVYRFNGGSLAFGGTPGVIDTTATAARNSQINSNLTGTAGLEISATGGDSGDGRLVLGGQNSGLTGGITVKAGLLALTSQAAAGANTLTLDGGGLFGAVNHSGTGATIVTGLDQLLNNNLVLADSDSDSTLTPNRLRVWGGRNLVLNGAISGVGSLRKVDTGTLLLPGTLSFTGPVTVFSGALLTRDVSALGTGTINLGGSGQPTLGYYGTSQSTNRVLNFSTGSGGIITAHGNLTLTSDLTGAATPMGLIFNGGGSGTMGGVSTGALINFAKQGIGTWTVTGALNLVGGELRAQGGILNMTASSSTVADANVTRANNGVIRLASGSGVKTATVNTSGILGGWATFDNITWAKTNGAGNAIDGFTSFTDDIWAAGTNTNVTLAGANPAADSTTHSLRFLESGAKTLTLSGTNTVTSGGILVASNVGSDTTTITGGTLVGANTLDLVLHQFNTAGPLVINSIIANNTGNTGLTKTGGGTVVLNGANSYRGTTRVFEGTLQINANFHHGSSPNKLYEVSSGATLELGYSTPASVYGYGVTVSGAGVSATSGLYFKGGNSLVFQSGLRLTGLPSTVRTSGAGTVTLNGWDSNGTHLAVEATASGSVLDSGIQFAPGSFGYVMNIAPGVNTLTADVTLQGPLTGTSLTSSYRKVGAGSLRITGTGTNSTPLQVRQGTAILSGGDNRLGAGSSVRLGEGVDSGLLVLEGINQTLTSLTNAGTGTDNRVVGGSATLSTLTINNSSETTLAAAIGGAGLHQNNLALVKNGIGNLILSGANTFTGDTTINAGGFQLDYSIHNNSKLSDTGTLTLGGTLILNGGTHQETVAQTIVTAGTAITRLSGSATINLGPLSRTGASTLNIAEANIATTTTPNDLTGRLPSWISINGLPAANDGSGNIVVYTPTFVDVFRLGGQIPNNAIADVRIVDGGTTGPVTLAASGLSNILSLTQNATGGPATIEIGDGNTLRLGELGSITGTAGASSLTIQGGTLTAGATTDNPGTLVVGGEGSTTIGSVLADNGAGPLALLKTGPGSLTLNAENTHSGGVTLNAGQLLIGDIYCLGLNSSLTLNGGAFDNVTGDALTLTDTIPQVWGGDFTYLGSNDLTFQSGGVNVTGNRQVTITAATLDIRSSLSGTSGFTKLGSGTLLLSSPANNWSGTTTVTGGVLEVPASASDRPYVVNPAGTLRLGYTTGGGYANTNLKLHGDGVAATTGLYLRGGASYNASGTIELLTAPTSIRQYGEGLAAIGMFDINGTGINGSAAASGSVIDANIQMISLGFGMSMTNAAGAATATGDLVINGPLNVGNLGFIKRGTGSVRLNGTATTGNLSVRIEGGRVITGVANAIGVNAALPISAGASLELNGFDQASSSLSGAGQVVNGSATAATLTVTQAADATFSGILGGAGSNENNFGLAKGGASKLTLTGANTYTGDTTVTAGALSLSSAYLADTSAVRVTTGATLELTHGQPDTVTALFVDGVQQPANTYNSGNSAFITGGGSLVVTTGPSGGPFATWATTNGLDGSPGKEAGFEDDPDGDGFDNGLEWILGGNPLDGQSGGLVTSTASAGGGLTLSFTRNEDAVGNATLTVEYNATLANPWNSATVGATTSGPDANGVTVTINTVPTPDSVIVNIPASNAAAGKLFGRLKATKP